MALTKAHIIDNIREALDFKGFTRKKSSDTVETLLEIMKHIMESGEDVMISGFGRFSVRGKKERKGRNPSTGEDLMLRPRKVVTFRCSGKLRDKISRERKKNNG